MQKYECLVCLYVYDPQQHDRVEFKDLPPDWDCPVCRASKEQFVLKE